MRMSVRQNMSNSAPLSTKQLTSRSVKPSKPFIR